MKATLETYVDNKRNLRVIKCNGDSVIPSNKYPKEIVDFIEDILSRDIDNFETFEITIRKI